MPRYVVLRHECPPDYARPSHWDLMLEVGDGLRTWAIPLEPSPGASMIAEALGDHRLEYLDYEGPVSRDRGSVARWDRGTYRVERESNEELVVLLAGERLCGRATLTRLEDDPQRWRVTF